MLGFFNNHTFNIASHIITAIGGALVTDGVLTNAQGNNIFGGILALLGLAGGVLNMVNAKAATPAK